MGWYVQAQLTVYGECTALHSPAPGAPYLLPGDRCAHEPPSFTQPQYGSLEAMQVLQEEDDRELSRTPF